MSKLTEPQLPESDLPESAVRRRTLKAFGWFALAAVVPVGVYEWITHSAQSARMRKPFRRVLDANAQIAKSLFSNTSLVPTFDVKYAAKNARVNGHYGIKTPVPAAWQLQVDRQGDEPLLLTLDDIKALPKHEMVYDFKCIEGWSQVQHWGGARLSDFLAKYQLGTKGDTDEPYAYVGLETPDKGYYVGIDMPSALHPQTLLAYELNGQPISAPHGAPLRLIIPVKYGVKNLKRIGRIFFADERPRDFWAERGYDYYIGL